DVYIGTFISDVDSDKTIPFTGGITTLNATSKVEIGKVITTGGVMFPAVRSSPFLVRDQFILPNRISLGVASNAVEQSFSYPSKYSVVRNPENLTRNVVRGEVIHFHNTAIDHEIWEVI